jgi:2-dehydropantoate 2-reductase
MHLISPRILVVGAGAVGCITAAVLASKEYDITLLTKYTDLAKKISEEGLQCFGHCGEIRIKVKSFAAAGDLTGLFDLVFLAIKGNDMAEAARQVLPFIKSDSRIVSMQNGICEEELAKVVGKERTVGCVVGWGATLHNPGVSEMTSTGEFVLGNWGRERDPDLEVISDILSHILPVEISANIVSDLYSKLIINSCISTLGAVSGQYLGTMLSQHKVRNLFITIIRESMQVAGAMNLVVKPYAGKLDYYRFLQSGLLSSLRRHLTILVIGYKYRKLKSSSLQSLERGRKTEIDNFNGYIAAKGSELGIATPLNFALVSMVKEIESGTRKISPLNFNEM